MKVSCKQFQGNWWPKSWLFPFHYLLKDPAEDYKSLAFGAEQWLSELPNLCKRQSRHVASLTSTALCTNSHKWAGRQLLRLFNDYNDLDLYSAFQATLHIETIIHLHHIAWWATCVAKDALWLMNCLKRNCQSAPNNRTDHPPNIQIRTCQGVKCPARRHIGRD